MGATEMKIGCPVCGAVLIVRYTQGIEQKSVTCPVCKTSSPFPSFKRVADAEPATELPTQENLTIGTLRIEGTDTSFQLKEGMNVIGRQSPRSTASIQLPEASRRISRDHLDIEVKRVPGRGYLHYVSLHKSQVNPTYIGDTLLEPGDKLVLESHDLIRLPDLNLLFAIPDAGETLLTPLTPPKP
ncbi:MAG: FHA domain-containing protein [Prevotellaceae bacterium]|nr:FHA domain-containing protein [Prevotellaceae bacterium]